MVRSLRMACAAFAACIAISTGSHPAAAAGTAILTGRVLSAGLPVADAIVSATGNNITVRTRTDRDGRFSIPDLWPGTYTIVATAQSGTKSITIDLPAVGADVSLDLTAKELAVIDVTARSTARNAGTDVTLNRQQITRSPAAGGFPSLLVQLPGAARGANGVVHINGDHGDINYIVDGVSVPQELNRNIGTEFNADDVSFVDVLEGAYPAQYGE